MNQLHAIALATAATVALAPVPSSAQARPDFSGSWVLSEGTGPACRESMTVSQDTATLTLGSSRTVTHKFDGSDTIQPAPPAALRPASASPTEWIANAAGSVSRAAWNGDQFVIVTHHTVRMTMPQAMRDAFERQNTFRETYALDAKRQMVVDTVAIIDPLPGGTPMRMNLPNAWTCRYARAAGLRH
jgi:hypothetical protein